MRGENARSYGSVTTTAGVGLSGQAIGEILARGDVREMRRTDAQLRKWLRGVHELVDELEQVIVELERPSR